MTRPDKGMDSVYIATIGDGITGEYRVKVSKTSRLNAELWQELEKELFLQITPSLEAQNEPEQRGKSG